MIRLWRIDCKPMRVASAEALTRRLRVTLRIAGLFLLFAAMATPALAGDIAPVPEPVSTWLVASGLVGLGVRAYKKRRQ